MVDIGLFEELECLLFNFIFIDERIDQSVGIDELLLGNLSVAVTVKLVERISQHFLFPLARKLRHHKCERCLSELVFGIELLNI